MRNVAATFRSHGAQSPQFTSSAAMQSGVYDGYDEDVDGLDLLGVDEEIGGFDYLSLIQGGAGMLSGAGGMLSGGDKGGKGGGKTAEQQKLEDEKARAEQSAATMKTVLIVLASVVGLGGIIAAITLGRK